MTKKMNGGRGLLNVFVVLLVVAVAMMGGRLMALESAVQELAAEPAGPAVQELGTTHFTNIEAEDITATDDIVATDDITADTVTAADLAATDDLTVADDATVGDDLVVSGDSDLKGNISSSTGVITATDNILIDGQANAVQLTVQGYTTQTAKSLVVETSAGTDVFTVDNNGAVVAASNLTYASDALRPLGFDGATNYEFYFGNASSVTNTTVTSATHSMTTAVDWASCYVSDPDADAGDPFMCVPTISGSSVSFQALDDDGDNASTAATKIYYWIVGR